MKLSTHAILQALAFILQFLNAATKIVPHEYQVLVACAIAFIQLLISVIQQFYNPDGTNAKAAWAGVVKVLILTLLVTSLACAQTPAPTPAPTCTLPLDFCESAWTVNVVGAYNNLTNAQTNNGFLTEMGIRFSTHLSGEARYFQTATPSGHIFVAGPQVDYGLGHLIKPTAQFDTTNIDLFAHVSPGLAWSDGTNSAGQPVTGATKFAIAIGGGVDYIPPSSPGFTIRILETSYVYSPMLPHNGQFLGNHLAVASGIRYTFGGQSTAAAQARKAAAKLRKQQAAKYAE